MTTEAWPEDFSETALGAAIAEANELQAIPAVVGGLTAGSSP